MYNGIISGFYLNSKVLGAGNLRIIPLGANWGSVVGFWGPVLLYLKELYCQWRHFMDK